MFKTIKSSLSKNPVLSRLLKPIYGLTLGKLIYSQKQKNLKNNYFKCLNAIDKSFKSIDICYWLEFGTLLGAIREKGAIKHDIDIDIGMFALDYSDLVRSTLESNGFKKMHFIQSTTLPEAYEETYEFEGISVDIFFFTQEDDSIYCYDFMREEPYSRELTINLYGGLKVRKIPLRFDNIGTLTIGDNCYPIPEPTNQHLCSHYGKNFMVYDPKWSSSKHAESAIFVDYSGKITYQ